MTLSKAVTSKRLLSMAGEVVFGRGKTYFNQGNVRIVMCDKNEAVAHVQGTSPYRVEITAKSDSVFQGECTCPAMHDWGFCKHAVAVGLALIDTDFAPVEGKKKLEKSDYFSIKYPNLADWIFDGCIEIGRDGHSTSLIRLIDEGGMAWEGGTLSTSLDEMLEEAEAAARDWFGN